MTGGGAAVGERLPGHRDELPVVARVVERHLEHAVGPAPDVAVGQRGGEAVGAAAAGAHGELAHPVDGVGGAARGLEPEALVDVVVPVEDDVGAVVVERLPERPVGGVGAVGGTRAVQGVVPHRHRAVGVGGGQDAPQPLLLRGTGPAPADVGAAGVEDDDVPGALAVVVVALGRIAGRGAEVRVVAVGVGADVLVVADDGDGPVLVTAPGRAVALDEVGQLDRGAVPGLGVGVVAEHEHPPRNVVEQRGGGLVVVGAAVADVAGADDHRVVSAGDHRPGTRRRGRVDVAGAVGGDDGERVGALGQVDVRLGGGAGLRARHCRAGSGTSPPRWPRR